MSVSVLNQFVNFQMLFAMSKEPDSIATTANLFRLVSLAKDDPEGCVRITPNTVMTSKDLAETFHCSPESMVRSVKTLQKYGIVTEENGKYYILALRKRKPKPLPKTLSETLSKTLPETIGENHNYNYNYNYLYNNKNKNNNYNYDATASPKAKASPPLPEMEPGRDGPAFVPDEYTDPDTLIPLEKLPLPCRNIVKAWNRLKLKSFNGLYPSIAENINILLEHYSEETIVNTIATIPQSPFLLGDNNTPNRWCVTFTWLLKPENFEKLRSGKYHKATGNAPESEESPGTDCGCSPLLAEMAQALGAGK